MATQKGIGRSALWLSPLVIIPVAGYFAMPLWENDYVLAVCGISFLGYAHFWASRFNRRLDEVQIASQRFAGEKGMAIGTFIGVAVMVVAPSMNALVDLVNTVAVAQGKPEKAVTLGIVFGYMMLVLLQWLGVIAASIWWWTRRLGRSE